MKIRDLMTHRPIRIGEGASLRRAAELISISEASDLMVTDERRRFIGVLSEGDILRAVLPSFDEVLAAGGTLTDAFAFFVKKGGELAERSIEPFVVRAAIAMHPDDEAAQAAVVMVQKQIRRLPVVSDGVLVGTVSRADIVRAVVYGW